MTYILVIVESPAKCGKIESYLGSGYKCIASFGHIQELPGIKYIDIDNGFKPNFQIVTTKSQQISKMRTMIKGAKEVLLALDDDREGTGIAWHVCQLFHLPLTTKRILFHEITKDAIVKAVQNPTRLDMDVVHAQQSRQILDVLVGYKITPLLWNHITKNSKNSLSAGRCQTPALRIVYDNHKEIESAPGKKVYNTTGYFTKMNLPFVLDHNFEIALMNDNIMEAFLEDTANFTHMYECSEPRSTTKNPPTPFTTSSLQQKASGELNISPKETMSICQKLYEGGYITYMRTDSQVYSVEFIEKAREYICDTYGDNYVHENILQLGERNGSASDDKKTTKDKKSKTKTKNKTKDNGDTNAQEAHEAIRPTNVNINEVPDDFSSREKRMYKLIWSNTVESCMSPAKYNSITAKITAPMNHLYKYSTELALFPGWKIVKGYDKENTAYQLLQTLGQNMFSNNKSSGTTKKTNDKKTNEIAYNKIICKVSIKELKSHYTEAKLVQLLEEKGIGRPSTFSSLLDKIQERGYVKKENVTGKKMKCIDYELVGDELEEIEDVREFGNEKNKLVIQPLGILVIEFLCKHFDKLFDYEYTKNMETELDKIAKGEKEWSKLCADCLHDIESQSTLLNPSDKSIIPIDEEHVYMIGKYGPVIKKTMDGKTSFLPVKKDIDMDMLQRQEYSLSDIVDISGNHNTNTSSLGKHNGNDVFIKNGKYGHYVECGTIKKSIKGLDKNILDKGVEELTLNHVMSLLTNSETTGLNSTIIRIINNNSSIRNGKFGHYIYYKTNEMTKPKFIKLMGFKGDYKTCMLTELEQWITKCK